jgi:hypothetical protein
MKTSIISVRVSDEAKAAAERMAADDNRSVSSLLNKLLVEFLKRRGMLKK